MLFYHIFRQPQHILLVQMDGSFTLQLPVWAVEKNKCLPEFATTLEDRMKLILEFAELNIKHNTGGPFAAGVFERDTGRPVVIGVNRVVVSHCSSAHAEVMALSLAQQILGTYDLGNSSTAYQLVVNWLPCAMCFGATCWSGIRSLVIAGSGPELESITGFDEGPIHPEWPQQLAKRGIEVVNNVCREEALSVYKLFAVSNNLVYNARQGDVSGMRFVEDSFVQQVTIPEQKEFDGRPFPLTLSPKDGVSTNKDNFIQWLVKNRSMVDDLLLHHKGILFRDFPMTSHDDFHSFIEATGLKEMDYLGGAAVRTQLTSRVFTANESPASEKIPFHHEMAQTPSPPTHLFFFCESAPSAGGETPILISSEVCDRLDKIHGPYMQRIQNAGVRYIRTIPEFDDPSSAIGRGWRSTYLCEERSVAEEKLKSLGSSWEWQEGGNLKTVTAIVPAIVVDNKTARRTHRKTFFNSMVAAYTGWNDSRNEGCKAVRMGGEVEGGDDSKASEGEGELIDPTVMKDAEKIMDDICVAFRWQNGDVLLLDNRTTMHSRRPYEGPRRILAGLARDQDR